MKTTNNREESKSREHEMYRRLYNLIEEHPFLSGMMTREYHWYLESIVDEAINQDDKGNIQWHFSNPGKPTQGIDVQEIS